MLAGLFLAALEATAVATAMPTAVADLGGMSRYSWAFSAYLLTSTTLLPLAGRLADLYGRRTIYVGSMGVFLVGSALCGLAQNFDQLILFRAIQGMGAAGVMPVSNTIIADIYTLEERARVQGLFSAVWALASLIGPAVGGIVTDLFSWRYIFYFTIPFGLLSAIMLTSFLREPEVRRKHNLDIAGTALLTGAIALLLVAILEGSVVWGWSSPWTITLMIASVIMAAAFIRHESMVDEPILPLDLFRNRIIVVSSLGSIVIGTLLFTLTAYVPMFVQGVLGGTASQAGAPLIAMSIGWPIASTTAGHFMIRIGYRPLIIVGGTLSLAGGLLLVLASHGTSMPLLLAAMTIFGMGMGFAGTPYLVAVQNAVPWNRRGVTTSVSQFSRTIGGAIAVAAFGVLLNARLQAHLNQTVDANVVLSPEVRSTMQPETLAAIAEALGTGLTAVFVACVALACVGFVVNFYFPSGAAQSHVHRETPVEV